MTEKEIGEIRRRVRRERSNMAAIYGCFVNEQKEIITSKMVMVVMAVCSLNGPCTCMISAYVCYEAEVSVPSW